MIAAPEDGCKKTVGTVTVRIEPQKLLRVIQPERALRENFGHRYESKGRLD